MITRRDGEGLIIIRQGDHAALAAEIGKAWHPPRKPNERPNNSLLVAAEHHDDGWRAWEEQASNLLDDEGRPRDFMHMLLDDHLGIWRDSIDQTTQFDLYAGVLVSMHAVALYEGRLATRHDPEAEREVMRGFIVEQNAWQEGMHPLLEGRPFYEEGLSEGGLAGDLRLLQTLDTLSLMLCVPWTDARTFERLRLPDDRVGTLTATPTGEGVLALDPYPLHHEPFYATVTGRRLSQARFDEVDTLSRAYALAPEVTVSFTFHAI